MPYRLRGSNVEVLRDGRWRTAYRHTSRRKALAQLRALYANVPEARRESPAAEAIKGRM